MVQEYGRYFGMPTVCFRGGCLTGPNHSGAELHGFLAYLARAIREGRTYRIFGYKGKQVRDNIHSLRRLRRDAWRSPSAPRPAAVYNLGGGRGEQRLDARGDRAPRGAARAARSTSEYVDEPRRGDHICYISDLRRLRADYPEWDVTVSLDEILEQLVDAPRTSSV